MKPSIGLNPITLETRRYKYPYAVLKLRFTIQMQRSK